MPKANNLFSRVYRKESISQINILGISGSPRVQGNSDILLDKVLAGAAGSGARIEKIRINDYRFIACQACENTRDDGYCSINDDFQKIYRAILKAEMIFLSSPIYFGSLSAQTKIMIDRFQCHWHAFNKIKKASNDFKKKGYFLSVQAGFRDDFFVNAVLIVRNFFASIGVQYRGELLCRGVDEKGSIMNFPDELKKAAALGKSAISE